MNSLHVVGTRSEVAAQVEVHVQAWAYFLMHLLRIVGTRSEVAAQVEAQVHCAQLWVGGLRIVGTTSEAVAQVEAQGHVCIGVGGRAFDLRHE